MKVLFLCTANALRSPTAETLFGTWPELSVQSAGTDPDSPSPLTAAMVAEADLIFTMEKHHRDRVRKKYKDRPADGEILTLHIPDEYERDDPELVQLLKAKVTPQIKARLARLRN